MKYLPSGSSEYWWRYSPNSVLYNLDDNFLLETLIRCSSNIIAGSLCPTSKYSNSSGSPNSTSSGVRYESSEPFKEN